MRACSLELIADPIYGDVLSETCSQQGDPTGRSDKTHVEIQGWSPQSPASIQLSGPHEAQPTLPQNRRAIRIRIPKIGLGS